MTIYWNAAFFPLTMEGHRSLISIYYQHLDFLVWEPTHQSCVKVPLLALFRFPIFHPRKPAWQFHINKLSPNLHNSSENSTFDTSAYTVSLILSLLLKADALQDLALVWEETK